MTAKRSTKVAVAASAIEGLEYSWLLTLRAANRSEHTIALYREALRQFVQFLREDGAPMTVDAIAREHVERWILWLREAHASPSTVATRWRGLRQFWKWCIEDGEIERSPMERMKEPSMPETPRRVISADDLRALVAACEGRDFISRRNMAIIRVLIDTGMRREECGGIKLDDIDWQASKIMVRGKGARHRWVKIGKKALRALDAYRRVRANHPHADLDALWLAPRGALRGTSLRDVLDALTKSAGIARLHPHLFRHTFADNWLENGGQEGDLMELAGWRSQAVMYRYGKARRAERALQAHTLYGPGDRI